MADTHSSERPHQPQRQQHQSGQSGQSGAASHTQSASGAVKPDEQRLEHDKKSIADEREARGKAIAEREKNRGTPTPTQEEADLLKLGHHPELAKDGSPPDPNEALNTVRHIGAKPSDKEKPGSGDYSTRSMSPRS